MKNWFGLERHKTDEYIHWNTSVKERFLLAERLRKAYDEAQWRVITKEELDFLLDQAYETGVDDGHDACNPDL